MSATLNAVLGCLFLLLSFSATMLMYRLWGYPFDKVKRKSAAPPGLMRLHRMLGYAYLLVYLALMSQMVPRLWNFQVEFPARTVAHIVLGITIGVLLVIKLAILLFNRHFEEWMPVIGTALFVCTVLLIFLSVPFALRDRVLARQTVGGNAFSAPNLARVKALLPDAGFAQGVNLETLATPQTLRLGQQVLATQCTVCHDLRTVLLRPRTPADWVQTVRRMSEKPNPRGSLSLEAQNAVAAYLIAITPDLQASVAKKNQQDAAKVSAPPSADAKLLFEKTCAQCHDVKLVENYPLSNEQDVRELVKRMVANGLNTDDATNERIIQYLKSTRLK